MVRARIYVFFIIFFIGNIVDSTNAAESPSFGYTSVSQAVLMHPLMAKFDCKSGRFFPAAVQEKNKTKREEQNKKNELRKKALLNEKTALKQEIQNLEKEFFEKLKELAQTKENKENSKEGSNTPPSQEYNLKRQSLENDFHQKIVASKNKLSFKENELEKLEAEGKMSHLTSVEDTNRIFKMILDDIYEAVDCVADHYKIQFVFNNSVSTGKISILSGDGVVNPMVNLLDSSQGNDNGQDEESEINFFSRMRQWSSSQVNLAGCTDPRLDRFILKGGVNMTPAVVDYVYQKYKLTQKQRDSIQKYFKAESSGK